MTGVTPAGDLATAWWRWIGVLRGHGWNPDAVLRPPAGDADLAAAEEVVGRPLPTAVRALLTLADGQVGPHEVPDLSTVLFPASEFLSLAGAVRCWLGWRDIREQYGPAGLASDFDAMITVRGDDPVRRVYTHPAWWPFAEDGGGNCLWVDTDPPAGGTVGQVVVAGPDEDERRVLAPDLTAYLDTLVTARLDPPDATALEDGVAFWDAPDLR